MSKSIYDEAIEILLDMGAEFISVPCNPIGEENSDMIHLRDVNETYETNMHEVVKALKQAQKQEKLQDLYKEYFEYSEMLKDGRKFGGRMLVEHERDKIIEEIKELENDK